MTENINNNKNDLDDFPIYDEILRDRDSLKLSGIWRDFLATFKENLSGYLSSGGIFLPNLTTTQRDALQSPQLGQIIYNSSTGKGQIYQPTPTVTDPPDWVDFS